jgi:exodeoxyribonuclease VII large subunit
MPLSETSSQQEREIYSVAALNQAARLLLENRFPAIWVEGELSNFVCASSGHWYFSLKDEQSQIRGAMFRNRNRHLNFMPENGMQVMVKGKVSLYENRGDYQLIVEDLEPAGDGALQRAFDQLYKKLDKQGLFLERHKQELPEFPKTIGVITSPTGAAIRDILTTLERRFPAIPVIIYPSLVQGNQAPDQLIRAIEIANQRQECDVLLLARGGGSMEDLCPFNDEQLAYTIFESEIPIVSGVGHEIDFTIADFVADHRAPTPTGAAEIASPKQQDILYNAQQQQIKLTQYILKHLQELKQTVTWLKKRIQHPGQRIQQWTQRLDYIERHLISSQLHAIRHYDNQLHSSEQKLQHFNPLVIIDGNKTKSLLLQQRLMSAMEKTLEQSKQQLQKLSYTLDAVSPLNTLKRGYAIVSDQTTNKVIISHKSVKVGQTITARLAQGSIQCTVDEKKP